MNMGLESMRQTVGELGSKRDRGQIQLCKAGEKLTKTLGILQHLCDQLKGLQDADDRDVQRVHRDLGEVSGAANQQHLGSVLSSPENQEGGGKGAPPLLSAAPLEINPNVRSVHDLLAIVEAIRVRNKQADVVRLKAHAASAVDAIDRKDWPAVQRLVESIVIELARGLAS
jgi:hypothetical protein